MNKAEIVAEIAKSAFIEKGTMLATVEKYMEIVKDTLAHGDEVTLRGFGTFQLKQRAKKTARNISKNTTIIIPAHKIPAFKLSESFKSKVVK